MFPTEVVAVANTVSIIAGGAVLVIVTALLCLHASNPPDHSSHTTEEEQSKDEYLTDEELLLRLLRERGGEVKQQEVSSQLDWTEAKTSRVITNMEERGVVEVFKLGRENIIHLADSEDTENS